MTAPRSAGWSATLASGVLWGVIVMLLDTLGQPVGDLSALLWLQFSLLVMIQWSLVGLTWTIAARITERRGQALIGYFLTLAITCVVTPLSWLLIAQWMPIGGDAAPTWLPQAMLDPETLAYLCWENAFYGGAYLLGYVATQRSVRLRQRLAEVLRTRGEADVQLREARLRAYRGQLQPELMLEALAALRTFSRTDPALADRVFDHLVAFLRAAMPAIRSGEATLASELATLQRYAELRDLIAGKQARLHPIVGDDIADLPFPPLTLLPALHALVAALPPDGMVTLSARSSADTTTLALDAMPPVRIGGQLRAALRLAFGETVRFAEDAHGRLAVEIRHVPHIFPTTEFQGGEHVTS